MNTQLAQQLLLSAANIVVDSVDSDSGIVWFHTTGGARYTAKVTKSGKVRARSVRLDV